MCHSFPYDVHAFAEAAPRDALAIPKAVVGGYDWGGRACCIVSALWPEQWSRSSPGL